MAKDNSMQIASDIKWFMFDDEEENKDLKNEKGFSHELKFVDWAGDGQSFIVKDSKGEQYRVRISKEELPY